MKKAYSDKSAMNAGSLKAASSAPKAKAKVKAKKKK